MNIKSEYDFQMMKSKSGALRSKYTNHVPILVERAGDKIAIIDKTKFLVPSDFTVSQFVYVLRKRLELKPETAIFIFFKSNIFPSASSLISEMDDKYRDDDGFLRIKYCGEYTFG